MNNFTFRSKQSLGQNFLTDDNVARKIIKAIAPKPEDIIVEIGPGFGALTRHLVDACCQVIAVEIDKRLSEKLAEKFVHFPNFTLITNDFLDVEIQKYFQPGKNLRIVGNIPYHITSPVIFKIFEIREHVRDMILMIQREVAQRIVAKTRTKDYGILSVFSQLYSEPKILFHVSKNVFNPKPDVDSTDIRWDFSRAPEVLIKDKPLLDKIIRASFNQRRKMLRKSLQQLEDISEKLHSIDFDLKKRPEELSFHDFVQLSNILTRLL